MSGFHITVRMVLNHAVRLKLCCWTQFAVWAVTLVPSGYSRETWVTHISRFIYVTRRQESPEGGWIPCSAYPIPYETSFILFLNPNQELFAPALIRKSQAGCKLMLNCVGVTWCPTSGGIPPGCDLPWYHPNRPTIPNTRSTPDEKALSRGYSTIPLSLTTVDSTIQP